MDGDEDRNGDTGKESIATRFCESDVTIDPRISRVVMLTTGNQVLGVRGMYLSGFVFLLTIPS